MDNVLDVFKSDAFGVISLTDTINKLPHTPSRIGEMGLFEEGGIDTLVVAIEEKNGLLSMVANLPRGSVPAALAKSRRKLRNLTVPHLPQFDSLLADQIQSVRSFGTGNQMEAVQQKVNDLLADMRRNLDVTIEYHRVGAIKGQILDSDGNAVIYNLFTEFEVTQQTHTMVLDTTTTDVMKKCREIARKIETELGGLAYTGLRAFCGSSFFDKLIGHTDVKAHFLNFQDARILREEDLRYGGVRIGNIIWEEYRGKVGSVDFFPATKAYVYPTGVPNLFKTYYSPADYIEAVNTIGLPYYAKQELMDMGKGVNMEAQSNPLCICKRPRAIIEVAENT